MDCEASMDHLLERMLFDPSAEPTNLPLSFLKSITNDFSDHEIIGSGGFAAVYKGILQNGTFIAVKKLFHNLDMDDEKFIKEVGCLMKAKHKNIVQFFGYCSNAPGKILNHEGRTILAEEPERLLCFEFLHKGSLDKYITDVSEGLEWKTRYEIIKGICEGLHYLHQDIHIVHSDLKPANILLDENMIPKIADFGLARCFDGKQNQTTTSQVMGTLGYLAPESYDGVITFKSDIYSLGIIIIEILTGRKGYCDIQNVLDNWTNRFKTPHGVTWLEHIRVCAQIGLNCRDIDPEKRPTTWHVINRLAELEHKYGFIETDISASQVLGVYPLNIWFPLEQDKDIKYPVTLINRTDDFIGVIIKPTGLHVGSNNDNPYMWEMEYGMKALDSMKELYSSIFKGLEPHSSVTIFMARRKQQQTPLDADIGMFDVVMVRTKSKVELVRLGRKWYYFTDLREAKEFGTVVHEATLRAAVTSDPALCQGVVVGHQIIPAPSGEELNDIICMDVHPTKSWLLVGYSSGHVSIWNYETQAQERVFQVPGLQKSEDYHAIYSVKFIAGEQWFAAGDHEGCVHVCAYTCPEIDKVKEFEAYSGHIVSYLAVYPKDTLLLTASASPEAKLIKLWDWSHGWTCTRVIDKQDAELYDVKVSPWESSTFDIGRTHKRVKVWGIHSATFVFNRWRFILYTDGDQRFVASTIVQGAEKIRDWPTGKHPHKLLLHEDRQGRFGPQYLACHPTLPILATILFPAGRELTRKPKVHHVVFWDVGTYRAMERAELLLEGDKWVTMMFNDGTEDITR